jgi:hypothetical protein
MFLASLQLSVPSYPGRNQFRRSHEKSSFAVLSIPEMPESSAFRQIQTSWTPLVIGAMTICGSANPALQKAIAVP